MLNANELTEIQKAYHDSEPRYRRLSEFVKNKCDELRQKSPKVARIILPREPIIKTLESVTKKIEDRRADKLHPVSNYRFKDMTDLVAVSILCPFESDFHEIDVFLRKEFDVAERTEKDHESGHRGFHYIVSVSPTNSGVGDLADLQCEIQVKTILAEAFDAKSHDLAYKPEPYEVGDDLKKQFSLLASGLRAIDGQSEFLKTLIVSEQKEMDLRRKALLANYLCQGDTIRAGDAMGIHVDPREPKMDLVQVFPELRKKLKQREPIDPPICKFAALCALELGNEAVKRLALALTEKLVANDPESLRFHLLHGYVHWVLGEYQKAFEVNRSIINSAKEDKKSQKWLKQAQNNFVYFICDWRLFKKGHDTKLIEEARGYIASLQSLGNPKQHEADTIGLFNILFSDQFEEVERGRRLLTTSRRTREKGEDAKTYEQFYRLHDYVALSRLAKLAKELFDHPV